MSDIRWFEFDSSEMKGRIGVAREGYGLCLYIGDEPQPVAMVDLFYQSEEGETCLGPGPFDDWEGEMPPHVQLIIYDRFVAEPVAIVKFLPEGTRIFFERDVKEIPEERFGGPVFGYPPKEHHDLETDNGSTP